MRDPLWTFWALTCFVVPALVILPASGKQAHNDNCGTCLCYKKTTVDNLLLDYTFDLRGRGPPRMELLS